MTNTNFSQPKFQPGDKVFYVKNEYAEQTMECPDCLGTRVWTIKFADGGEEQIECQTCAQGFNPATGYIYYKQWQPSVGSLTIREIHRWDPEDGFKYMGEETSSPNGGGRVHREKELCLTKEDAENLANEQHEENMKHIARTNFSKRFDGKQKIESMLSTVGFVRSQKYENVKKFIQWADLSGLLGSKETKHQFNRKHVMGKE